MPTHLKSLHRPLAMGASGALRVIAVLALAALSACMTEAQVQKLVGDSNALLLASRLSEDRLTPRGEVQGDVTAQIEEFIAQHPEQSTLNAALRVRQAIAFLGRKDYNQADAAFKAAQRLGPVAARDQALVAVHEHLVWWSQSSAARDVPPERAAAARKAFIDEARKRSDSPDIRDFLAESSAWVGLKAYSSTTAGLAAQQALLVQTVDDYAFILDAADLDWLCQPTAQSGADTPLTVRRRLRTLALLRDAAVQAAELRSMNLPPRFASPVLQALISPPSPPPASPALPAARVCAPLSKAPA